MAIEAGAGDLGVIECREWSPHHSRLVAALACVCGFQMDARLINNVAILATRRDAIMAECGPCPTREIGWAVAIFAYTGGLDVARVLAIGRCTRAVVAAYAIGNGRA